MFIEGTKEHNNKIQKQKPQTSAQSETYCNKCKTNTSEHKLTNKQGNKQAPPPANHINRQPNRQTTKQANQNNRHYPTPAPQVGSGGMCAAIQF